MRSLHFDLVEANSKITRGFVDFDLGKYGDIHNVVLGGVHCKKTMTPEEFIELLVGQGYLFAKASEIDLDELEEFKNQRDLKLERMA